MIESHWFGLCLGAICMTWDWTRRGGIDPIWRILCHVLSIVAFLGLWIADIVLRLQAGQY
jgi:hypothetical protein